MAWIAWLVQIASAVTGIGAAVVLLVRPIRERVTGARSLREGQRCLLRSDMLHTYYKNRQARQIRQYELENFISEYRAYKSLRGNTFIDRIYEEVRSWEVVT